MPFTKSVPETIHSNQPSEAGLSLALWKNVKRKQMS